jgi:hypothetical protein
MILLIAGSAFLNQSFNDWRLVGDVVACPVCDRRSVYNRDEDRFFHLDGSANAECWCAISRGETIPRWRTRTAAGALDAADLGDEAA